jgi:glutaminyl-tRNA synthetase
VVELHCTYDPDTRSGGPSQRKVKSTIHWVSVPHAMDAEARLYDALLKTDLSNVPSDQDWTLHLNPRSLEHVHGCMVEPSLKQASPGVPYQFERQGYFCVDPDSSSGKLVFNRTVSLKDTWAKVEKAQQGGAASIQ